MIIGGLEKLTLLDYPDHLAAIIFTQGCNFRCHFCYNPMLVLPREGADEKNIKKEKGFSPISPKDLFLFLESRRNRLDGVVITGGEPTLHADLPVFIKKIKALGYLVKLDSNGTNPEMLKALIKDRLIDYIAMDLKAPPDKYELTTNVPVNCNNLAKSVKIIKSSGLPYEFRTTVVPGLLHKEDFKVMGEFIKGASKWYLQNFKSDTDLVNKHYQTKKAYTNKEMSEFAAIGRQYVDLCEVRG
ncbi:MAG: anaerobic ribonucleoside-triphosphate reductase activating protein [Patescibacteria group bacterium]|jgi:pyruvate formate lyase activating enzyme